MAVLKKQQRSLHPATVGSHPCYPLIPREDELYGQVIADALAAGGHTLASACALIRESSPEDEEVSISPPALSGYKNNDAIPGTLTKGMLVGTSIGAQRERTARAWCFSYHEKHGAHALTEIPEYGDALEQTLGLTFSMARAIDHSNLGPQEKAVKGAELVIDMVGHPLVSASIICRFPGFDNLSVTGVLSHIVKYLATRWILKAAGLKKPNKKQCALGAEVLIALALAATDPRRRRCWFTATPVNNIDRILQLVVAAAEVAQ